MTEKRFTYRYNSDEDGSEFEIIDLDKDEYYPMIETIETVVMALVDCLNNLHDENEQLKQKNQLLYEDIDFLKRFIEKRGFKAKLESDKR